MTSSCRAAVKRSSLACVGLVSRMLQLVSQLATGNGNGDEDEDEDKGKDKEDEAHVGEALSNLWPHLNFCWRQVAISSLELRELPEICLWFLWCFNLLHVAVNLMAISLIAAAQHGQQQVQFFDSIRIWTLLECCWESRYLWEQVRLEVDTIMHPNSIIIPKMALLSHHLSEAWTFEGDPRKKRKNKCCRLVIQSESCPKADILPFFKTKSLGFLISHRSKPNPHES